MNIFKTFSLKRQVQPPPRPAIAPNRNINFDYGLNLDNISKNPIVAGCIRLISRNIASIPLILPESTGIRQLIQRPNPQEDIKSIMERVAANLFVYGKAYLLFRDCQIYLLDPRVVREELNEFGIPVAYSYSTIKGQRIETIEDDGKCNILQIKYNDPFGQNLSPCDVVRQSVKLYNSITLCNQALMDNSARFSGALIINGNNIPEHDIEKIRAAIDEKVGYHQAGKAVILQGNLRWEQMKINAQDADYTTIQSFVAREIMQGLGVPGPMLGLNDTGFQHYKEARLHFWEDTLLPLAKYISGALSRWLSLLYDEIFELKLNLQEVPAFADKTDQRIQIVANVNFLSDEEKRIFCGLTFE